MLPFLTLPRCSFLVVDLPTERAVPLLRPKKFLEGRQAPVVLVILFGFWGVRLCESNTVSDYR